MLKLIRFSEAIRFDDDLVLIVTSYLKLGGDITNEIIEFFKNTDAYIKKNDGISLDCFEFLNIFILRGICNINLNSLQDHQFSMKTQFSQLVTYLLKLIKTGYSDKSEKEKSHFLSYNLLCILIQVKNFFS